MKKSLAWNFFILLLLPYSSFSQEYSYTHYDISSGLAGSTVYCITQDQDGFIWVGTETGVSRFDGTHFKNFTIADGLPDIEVLHMFTDSKGRVWMAPFRKSVCYYYRGTIHNQENDSLLARIRLRQNVESFAEDASGNILLQENTALHLITRGDSVVQYDSIDHEPIRESVSASRSLAGGFNVQAGRRVFGFSDKGFSFLFRMPVLDIHPNLIAMSPGWMVWRESVYRTIIRNLRTGEIRYRPFEQDLFRHISFTLIDDSLLYSNESTGTTEYNIHSKTIKRFLPGIDVSRTFRDGSGNLWFTTLGQGIFRLNSDEFRNIRFEGKNLGGYSIYAITRLGSWLWIGDNHNTTYQLSLPDLATIEPGVLKGVQRNRILYLDTARNGNYLIASDYGIMEFRKDYRFVRETHASVKTVFKMNDKEWLLSGSWGAGILDLAGLVIKDTLWRERATTAYFRKDTIYIGTLNGLYAMTRDRSVIFLGKEIPFLRKRVSSIVESGDGTLWIASYDDAGIIGYRNGKIVASITKKQGLTSDICRTLLVHNNILWAGTDKGLNKIELGKTGYPITQYSSNDGLGSDIVNIIYQDSSMIFVGTSVGLSYFDEARANVTEECRLYLLAVMNSGKDRLPDTARLSLSYKYNDIRLEFAGISYRSVGDIRYKYRLIGLDTAWAETKETYLSYPTLPSGNYEFQLQAINKFGMQSRLVSFHFLVDTPFWRTIWFSGLLLIVFFSLAWFFIAFRIKRIRRRHEEKEQLSHRMTELEHKALQSQMNPHFIFNCLNSIQQYIFDQDILAANKYISGFAKLIRATLSNSTQAFISLADEIDFLSGYLSLEKLRFKEKMDYIFEVDPTIDRASFLIPPMLIQPYVENSMRHGLRHKTDGKGTIRVKMQQSGDRLVVTIEDNGIGREKAGQYKTREHIEYQSKGMSLTADRIRIMNTDHGESIKVEVTDRADAEGRPSGTKVVIHFPLFHKINQEEDL